MYEETNATFIACTYAAHEFKLLMSNYAKPYKCQQATRGLINIFIDFFFYMKFQTSLFHLFKIFEFHYILKFYTTPDQYVLINVPICTRHVLYADILPAYAVFRVHVLIRQSNLISRICLLEGILILRMFAQSTIL